MCILHSLHSSLACTYVILLQHSDRGDSMDIDKYESVLVDEGPGPLRCEYVCTYVHILYGTKKKIGKIMLFYIVTYV